MPIAGAHSRNTPEKRSGMRRVTSNVTPAVTGPASGEASAGTSASFRRMSGVSVIGMRISTVPATVGVNTLRNSVTLTARNALVLPITRM